MPLLERDTEPLVAGDRMTREEFIRRAAGNPKLKLAELIGGRVYIMSPVSVAHGGFETLVQTCLGTYAYATPGCEANSNTTCYIGMDAPQPDAYLRIHESCGGKTRVGGNGYLIGSPELCAEVCLTSSGYDLNEKLELYCAEGVEEYVVVLLYKKQVRWHRLNAGNYEIVQPTRGIYRSAKFPGLWIDEQALCAGDGAQALKVLNRGLKSPEHKKFVRQLAASRR